MTRLVAIVVLLVVIYASTGVAVYLLDVLRDVCYAHDFVIGNAVWLAVVWPLRLLFGMSCD